MSEIVFNYNRADPYTHLNHSRPLGKRATTMFASALPELGDAAVCASEEEVSAARTSANIRFASDAS